MSNFQIRRADNNDLPLLEKVAAAMGAHHEAGYFARCLSEQKEGRRLILLAEEGGAVVGYAQLIWKPKYPLFRKLDMPEIQDLNVVPNARRNGIGALLVTACEETAQQQGKTHIGISVGLSASYGAAQRLYIKRGYVPDGAGIAYDDETVRAGELKAVDDFLALKLVKELL